MGDFDFINKISGEDAYLFKRCVRKLLDSTFILEDRDKNLYEFLASESNQYDMNEYLSVIGYRVLVEERMKVAMLCQSDDDGERLGIKKLNLFRFSAKQMRLLLVLWTLFLERTGYAEAIYVTVGEIMDQCKAYQIALSPAEFKNAYRVFKRFSLIDYNDDITTEDGRVRLYPSLQFCMDIGQLKQVMAEYVPDGEETETGGEFESEDADE